MRLNNNILLIIILSMFVIPLVSSAPPTRTITDYQRGVDIIHPETQIVKYGEDLEINFWTYNNSNGATLTNESLNCTLYIINNKGVQYYKFSNQAGASGLMTYGKDAPLCINCWTMTLPKENISVGYYSYQIKCQGEDIGGYTTGEFEVNPSGSEITSGKSIVLFSSLLLIILIGTIFLIIAFKSENKVMKISFFTFTSIIFVMSILYTIILMQQILFGFDNILIGIESFWFVGRFLVWIGFISLLVVIFFIMLKAWKIKRGLIDVD
jgi:hypothetical protein